jgi:hypothetical protein
MEIGSILVVSTAALASLALSVGAGYGAFRVSVALLRAALDGASSSQAAPLDNVVQMPIREHTIESDADIRHAA